MVSEQNSSNREKVKIFITDVFKCYRCHEIIKGIAYIDDRGFRCEVCAWK